ncbi:very short patch repair endonuclease [Fibrobacter sp. UWB4]|nr:very short patch repair endonuclease [Fibrobacter sp. UWB4]
MVQASLKKTCARKRKSCRKPMTRSQMMQAVHSENTKPEMTVRRALFKAGMRYRLHRRDLPGTPDIFVQKYGVAIFVNGCFWHQHGCKLTSRPKSNSAFWNDKFDRNIVRDIKTQHELSLLGYRVAIVWECSLRTDGVADAENMGAALTLERLIDFIKSDDETIEL